MKFSVWTLPQSLDFSTNEVYRIIPFVIEFTRITNIQFAILGMRIYAPNITGNLQ
ncbi:hypothetical protein SL053_002715 [Flavobacterium psychrophilum]|uniref:Uncharacterized protein n=2 Tax=Flavobacterium psychrophilum TaxID=96345 RepID=A6GYT7_FLAPJ|nr:hypothetical protein [Flavobacterium psychrophilum]AIJ38581.1 hypothetical protein FPSM_02086 [Flavobacterium psychrophilum]EKT2070231.1 hypothetical protein [Flavobacterium psychrophilum]EKT2072549.1 hypothetical protein [Flavobacterium psychrophilum]EKT3958470.1 hypothetical protein [Flavobacterium psychrophilum]EKT3962536.1 hypothetical protein [Flavobacterium psychrophilum]